jgi:hypothetical protein
MVDSFDELMNWDRAHCFSAVLPNFQKELEALCDSHGNRPKDKSVLSCQLFYLDRAIALDIPKSLSVDSAVEVKPLEESHAAILASKWEYAEPHAIEAITHCIKNLRSMGTFVEGKLVSWAILSTMGKMNVLYTEEKHRRKGYGKMAVLALAKAVATMGLTPIMEGETSKGKSVGMMKKLDFQKISETKWYFLEK